MRTHLDRTGFGWLETLSPLYAVLCTLYSDHPGKGPGDPPGPSCGLEPACYRYLRLTLCSAEPPFTLAYRIVMLPDPLTRYSTVRV